ncbi:hypothetical protein [Lentzea sp. NPDC004782]|uniref:hypothetical protein n=1 Tax=Lentzea sp. NPDC004782 TaxID=3154458 RepID=UPI0033A073A3
MKKEGLIPVAILSTAEFNAVTQVDRTSLTFGATGLEQSLVRCGSPGEDVNDDGRRFEGQDDVKLTGC